MRHPQEGAGQRARWEELLENLLGRYEITRGGVVEDCTN